MHYQLCYPWATNVLTRYIMQVLWPTNNYGSALITFQNIPGARWWQFSGRWECRSRPRPAWWASHRTGKKNKRSSFQCKCSKSGLDPDSAVSGSVFEIRLQIVHKDLQNKKNENNLQVEKLTWGPEASFGTRTYYSELYQKHPIRSWYRTSKNI